MKVRFVDLASMALVLVFVALIVSGLLVPIYADEVSTKMTQATVFSHNGRMLTAIPQCLQNMTMAIPVSWYPGAAIYHLIYAKLGPMMIRVSGVIIALMFVIAVALGFRRVLPANVPYWPILAGFFAVLGLGVLPLTLLLSRSEQWFLLLLTYFLFFPLISKKNRDGIFVFYGLIFLTSTALLFYTHPKAAFFSPLLVVSAWVAFRGRRWIQVLTVAFTLVCLMQSVFAAKELFNCAHAPLIASAFSKQTSNLSELATRPVGLLLEMGGNLLSFPEKSIRHAVFQMTYQSFWLPSLPSGEGLGDYAQLVNVLAAGCLRAVIVFGLLLPPVACAMVLKRGRLGDVHLLSMVLWFSLLGHLAIYRTWNFYGGILVFGILALLIAVNLGTLPWVKSWRKAGSAILVSVCSVFLLSAIVLFSSVMLRFFDDNGPREFGVPGQPLSVPTLAFNEQRERIRNFARACKLEGDASRRLVVDDLTYFAFDQLHEPIHLVYVSPVGMGMDIDMADFLPFLRRLGSPGIVAQCAFFPEAIKSNVVMASDNLCCLNFQQTTDER